ncbi:MAG: hypothetical protein IKE94_04790 [Aeriscardovia sp.]|nr:hypothetical protein [Aeriscardovia sp.]
MSKTKFELNLPGLNELMKSDEMVRILEEAGAEVANAAGADYAYRVHQASFVVICNVYPDSQDAAHENYEENTLLKAVGSVGLPMSKRG